MPGDRCGLLLVGASDAAELEDAVALCVSTETQFRCYTSLKGFVEELC